METVESVVETTEVPIESVVETEIPATEGEETQIAESEGIEGEETAEEVEVSEEPEQRTRPQTTAAERIQQLIEKQKQSESEAASRIQMLEQRLEQVMQTTQMQDPELKTVDMDAVNDYVAQQLDRYDELRLEGKSLEALKILKSINKLNDEVEAHEARRQQKLIELQNRGQQNQTIQNTIKRLDEAAKIVQAEYKITDEVFSQSAKFFNESQQKSPVLAKRYQEIIEKQGEMAAILFAKDYCDQHMGKTAKAVIEKREQAKANLPPAASAVSNKTAADNVAALYAEWEKNPNDSDKYVAWRKAKSQLS